MELTWPKSLKDTKISVTSTTIVGTFSGGYAVSVPPLSGGDGNLLSGRPGINTPLRSVLAPIAAHINAFGTAVVSGPGSMNLPVIVETPSWSANVVDVRLYMPLTSTTVSSDIIVQRFQTLASGIGISGATLTLTVLGV